MTTLGQKKSISTKEDFIKSIYAMFLKLELAYHYQFYKVFGTDEKLNYGQSITDACMGWDDTVMCLSKLNDAINLKRGK